MADAAPPPRSRSALARALYPALLGAGAVGLWLALAAAPYLPTNDGPQHIMMGHIENAYDGANPIYRHFLAPAPQYAGRGFAALFVPLESFLPWRTAYRLTVYAILLAWATGFAAFVHAFDRRRRAIGLLGFAMAFQWTLYMGFFAFLVGSACGLFLLAFVVSSERLTTKRLAILSLGLLLQSFLHVFSALLTATVVGAIALGRGRGVRARLGTLARVAVACLPALAVFASTFVGRGGLATIKEAQHVEWAPLSERLHYVHRTFLPGADPRGIALFALAAIGLARGVAAMRRRDGDTHRDGPALALASTGFLALGLLGPDNVPGWQFFYQRFLPLGVVLALPLLDVERLAAVPRALACVALGALTAYSLRAAATLSARLYARNADVYQSVSSPPRVSGLRLPLVRDAWHTMPPRASPVPGMVPLHSVFGLFVVEQGGLVPYLFIDSPPVHEFVARDDAWEADMPPHPDGDALQKVAPLPLTSPERLRVLDDLAFAGTAFADVLLVSEPADADAFRRRGYVDDEQRGELYIGHYRGCEAEAVLPAIAGIAAFEYGFWPRGKDGRRVPLEGIAPASDGRLHVPLPGAPCGPVWMRLEPATGGDAPSVGPCRGADASGRLVTSFVAGRKNAFHCDL